MNFFLLDKQQNIVKLLPEKAIIEAKLEEGINTAAKLNLTVDYTSKIDNSIFYLCVPTDRDDDSFLMLKIISETVHDKQVDYICMESAYDELSKYAYIKDLRPQNETAGQLVNAVLKDTRWTLGYAQETDTASMNFYYQTVLECLQKIVKEFDVELEFDVYIDSTTNKINRRQVNVYAQMGRRTGKRFEYGSNLLSVKREESSDTIFTAIVGRGSGVQNTDGQGNITGGYTRRITFADVEWSKAKGDPLNKPKGQEWLEDPEATAAYGFSDGKPRIGLQVFEDVKDPNELLKATYESLKQAKIPKVQFSASVLDVGDLHLGDTVAIIRHDVGIEYFTRVFKVTRDLLDKNNNKVEFGDNLTESTSITAQISKIENVTNKNSQNIGVVMNAANGKNKVFYTNKLPETADKGDICYLDLGNGETAMYIWDKGWHLVVSTKDTDAVKKQVEEAQKGIDDAKKSADEAVSKADDLVAQVGNANTNAQKAVSIAQQNQADLAKTKNDLQNAKNQLSNVQADLTSTKSTLSGAVSNISQAQEDIKSTEQSLQGVKSDLTSTNEDLKFAEENLSTLTEKAQEQGQTIVDIQKKQSGITADIADVKGNVSSLQDTANGLQATVKDNQGNISKLQDTASSLQASIKDNQGNISKLQSTANSLQSSIQNNKNDISTLKQTASGIESTVVNMQNVGQNLIVNSNFKQGDYHWNLNGWTISKDNVFRNNKIVSKTQGSLTSPNWSAVNATDFIPVHHGQKISIGVWVKASDVDSSGDGNWGASFGVEWFANTHSGRNHWNDYDVKEDYGNHDWRFLKLEGLKVPNNSNFARAHFFLTQNGTAQFALPIMVYGDTLPAWSPSPLDSATASDMSSVEQTIDGLKSTVQSNKGDISTLKQTASGLESDVKDNKNNISAIKQTADKVQSTVSNMKVGGTNLLPETQNYTGYMRWSNVEVLDDYSYNNYQFKPQTKIIHLWTNNNNPIDNAYPTPDNKLVHIIKGKQYTFSAYVWHYGDEAKADELVTLYANNGNATLELGTVTTTLTNQALFYHFTFTAQQTGDYTRFRVVHRNDSAMSGGSMFIAEMKLEEGNVATDWSPSPYDLASQSDLSSVEQTVNNIQSTVQSNSGKISQVQQTADQLQSTVKNKVDISQFNQQADKLQSTIAKIGTYLQNGNFDDKDISKYWVPWDTTKDLSEILVGDTNRPDLPNVPPHYLKIATKSSENKTDIGTKDFIPVNVNEGLQVKAWSYLSASNGNTKFKVYIHSYDKNNNEIDSWDAWFRYDNLKEWEQTDISWDSNSWNKDTISIRVEVVLFGGGIDTYGAITGLKVINGSNGIASQFTQSLDGLESKIQDVDGNISQLKQTADSLGSQIGNANNDISSLKQRADSLESNISDNKNDISDLRQTASSLQSNIQSKADISQITQLSNAFQTVVQNIGPLYPNGDFSDPDLSKYYDPWDSCKNLNNFSVVTNNKDWGYYLQICTPHGTVNKMITKEYLPINAQAPVVFKGKSLLSYGGKLNATFVVYMHFYDSNKNGIENIWNYYKYDHNNTWQDFSLSFDPPKNSAYVRVETLLDNSNGQGVYWGALDNLSIENGEATIASKISQMTDDINLRVQKGDLLSQINIQAGSTLIQSNKLFLDASSVVFSGNAFIPSAAITDLSADKITAGTLNAGNVNVINLDVNKLVGNTTEFVRSGWTNAYGSNVTIDGGGMSVHYGDWDTAFNSGGVSFNIGGSDIGGFSVNGMIGMPDWYQGLVLTTGSEAEFFSIGAKDYHNANQNPIPSKLLWMRGDINGAGYNPGWNFLDDVWMNKAGIRSIQFQDWNIHFGEVSGDNGFSALTLTTSSGDGFYWGSDGSFGYVTGGGSLHNVRGSQIVHSINGDGTCQNWTGVD